MKVYDIAAVTDCGSYYEVDFLTTSLSQDFLNHGKFLGLNNIAANVIKDALSNNSIVRIVKDYQDLEVMPRDIIIIEQDSIDSLEFNRKLYLQKARQQVVHQQAIVSGIQMYEFIMLNNYFNSKGYYIHDDNREEVYLNILETGDDSLVDKLEQFLNAKEDISRAAALEKLYQKFYLNISSSKSLEDIEIAYNKLMEQFQIGSSSDVKS